MYHDSVIVGAIVQAKQTIFVCVCVSVCVCIYVCVYVCMYVRTCLALHAMFFIALRV
jgi:hypothetical protein